MPPIAGPRRELSRHLLEYRPAIVHFTGHGSPTGEIVLEGDNGRAETVGVDALVALFDALKGTEAIVLNACYSQGPAMALAKVVPQVIGMARAIGDDAAMSFAAGFYRGLLGERTTKPPFAWAASRSTSRLFQTR